MAGKLRHHLNKSMKVKFTQSISTRDESYGYGQEAELPDLLAKQWTTLGYCVAVHTPAQVPTAPEVQPLPVEPEAPAPVLSRKQRRAVVAPSTESDLM
jgi:hypothetical protein